MRKSVVFANNQAISILVIHAGQHFMPAAFLTVPYATLKTNSFALFAFGVAGTWLLRPSRLRLLQGQRLRDS
jgi:hypothetical protein